MHEILVRPVLSVHLAFGLEWLPLISGRASSAARRIARRHKATHVVLDGEAPASFGYGLSRKALRHGSRTMHSAAQNMARLYPSGSVAAILPLLPEGHWLVAVHEGAVMARTDVVYRSPEQAMQALHALQAANPRLVLLPESNGPTLEAVAGASDSGTALRDTGRRRRQWLLGVFLLAAALFAWILLEKRTGLAAARSGPAVVDATKIRAQWKAAISLAERDMVVHGVAATHAALRHLYDTPAVIAGWALGRVSCSADGRAWRCGADYDRKRLDADNDGMLASAPPGWRLDFPSIDRATASWSFHTDIPPAGPQDIDDAAHHRRHVQSAWQGIRPAFSRMALGPPRRVEIRPPLDADGRPLPRPAGLRAYARKKVEFEGPLRSISLLLPHTRSIAWRSITLTLGEAARPTLVSSRLRVMFHGDLYERHETDTAENPEADQRPESRSMAAESRAVRSHGLLDGNAGRL